MTIKSIRAWFAGLFTKGKKMTDTVDTTADTSALATAADTSAQSAAVVAATLDSSTAAPAAVVVPVVAAAPVAAVPATKTEFEKLEELIEKYSLDSVEKVLAAIRFVRAAL